MKKKVIIISLIVLAVIVLSIIAYNYFKNKSKISVKNTDYPNKKITINTPFGEQTFEVPTTDRVVAENNDYQLGVRKSIDWVDSNGIQTSNDIGIEIYLVYKNENSKFKLETYKFYPVIQKLDYSKI